MFQEEIESQRETESNKNKSQSISVKPTMHIHGGIFERIDSNMYIIGSTPRTVKDRQFQQMAEMKGYSNIKDFASYILASNPSEWKNILKNYYIVTEPECKKIPTFSKIYNVGNKILRQDKHVTINQKRKIDRLKKAKNTFKYTAKTRSFNTITYDTDDEISDSSDLAMKTETITKTKKKKIKNKNRKPLQSFIISSSESEFESAEGKNLTKFNKRNNLKNCPKPITKRQVDVCPINDMPPKQKPKLDLTIMKSSQQEKETSSTDTHEEITNILDTNSDVLKYENNYNDRTLGHKPVAISAPSKRKPYSVLDELLSSQNQMAEEISVSSPSKPETDYIKLTKPNAELSPCTIILSRNAPPKKKSTNYKFSVLDSLLDDSCVDEQTAAATNKQALEISTEVKDLKNSSNSKLKLSVLDELLG